MDLKEFQSWLTGELKKLRVAINMETGIASFIENETYTIVAVDSAMADVFHAGMKFPLEDTYCNAVYKENKMVIYPHVGMIDAMLQHPVYQAVKLESYIAAPLKSADDKVIGTINFTSLSPNKEGFPESEQKLVQELADIVQQKIDLYLQALELVQ